MQNGKVGGDISIHVCCISVTKRYDAEAFSFFFAVFSLQVQSMFLFTGEAVIQTLQSSDETL